MRNITETDPAGTLPQGMGRRKLCLHAVKMTLRLCSLAALMMLSTTSVVFCQNLGPYTFTSIDNSPNPSAYAVGNLNNNGAATFTRYDPNAQTVYVGDGVAPLTKIADLNSGHNWARIAGPTIERNISISIDPNNPCLVPGKTLPKVVFTVSTFNFPVGPLQEIWVGDGLSLIGIATGVKGKHLLALNGGINDNGVVAYTITNGSNQTLWKWDGINPAGPQLIDEAGFDSFIDLHAGINNDYFGPGALSGTVSYALSNFSLGQAIILYSNSGRKFLATTCGGATIDTGSLLPINNNGLVGYHAVVSGGFVLCTKALNTPPEQVVTVQNLYGYDVNALGIVAFQAADVSAPNGIYTGSDLTNDKVVAVGDILPDGSTVTDLNFGGINDYCQISFSVNFQNGAATGSKVWRANASICPVPCPPDYTCGPARAVHQKGVPFASTGTAGNLPYGMLDELLSDGWSLPFSEGFDSTTLLRLARETGPKHCEVPLSNHGGK
jgi:hypothetical protein